MKIQYASDLHLELSGNSKYVKEIPFEVTGDVLVLAGDTAYLRDKNLPNSKFWKWASENYREVFLIPGNHEYYGFGDVLENGDSWNREILPNVHYHQNKVVRVDDTEINGTKVVCNQLGYVQRGEHEYGFDGRKFIEV